MLTLVLTFGLTIPFQQDVDDAVVGKGSHSAPQDLGNDLDNYQRSKPFALKRFTGVGLGQSGGR